MKEEQDLTAGSVAKKLVRFAFPLLLVNLLQSFYSLVDMCIVGRIVEKRDSPRSATRLYAALSSMQFALASPWAVPFWLRNIKGQRMPKDNVKPSEPCFSLPSSFLITIAGLFAYQLLFQALHVPADSMWDACDSMRVICYGTVLVFGYNAVCSIMQGLGDSKTALCFIAVAAIANILLDIEFVGFLGGQRERRMPPSSHRRCLCCFQCVI